MKNYITVIGSPPDYEELIADIIIDSKYVIRVQKEEGNDKMIIEFFGNENTYKIYLEDFINALKEAKSELLK